jgi:hypothetical protein
MAKKQRHSQQYSAELTWAAVAAADRFNEGRYVKAGGYREPEDRDRVSNRELALEFINNPSTIQEQDHEFGRQLLEHFRGEIFGLIKQQANDFMTTVAKIVTMPTVGNYELAVMSSLPSVYRRAMVRQQQQEDLAKIGAASSYLGSVGDKVTGALTVHQRFFSERYRSYIITGDVGGNIVKFFTSKDSFEPQHQYQFSARVKNHTVNDRDSVRETWLSHVKEK